MFFYFHHNLLICTLSKHSDIFSITRAFLISLLSVIVLSFSYKLVRTLKMLKEIKSKRRQDRNESSVRIIFLSDIIFFVSWVPDTIADILVCFRIIKEIPDDMEFIITWLADSNSFMTVLVYSGNSKEFRYRLKCCLQNCFLNIICNNIKK